MGKGNRNRAIRDLDPEIPYEDYPPWLKQRIREAARILATEIIDQYELEADASTLWVLHAGFGWGQKRLKQFYDRFIDLHKTLRARYEQPDIGKWYCLEELKKIGVDVCEWNKNGG